MTKKIGKIKVNWLFWKFYFLIIALPLHASNILTYPSVTGKVSIFQIIIALMMLWLLCEKKQWVE